MNFEGEEDLVLRRRFVEGGNVYLASRTGDLDRLRVLVEEEGVDINKRDFWDSVPLYYACLCGQKEVVKYLLEHGAVCSENTFDGDRCLYGALTVEIRDLLMKGDVNKIPPLKPLGTCIRKLCALCDDPEQEIPQSRAFDGCCDLEMTVDGHVYHLNKAIVASRLSWFDEMFSTETITDGIHRIALTEESIDRRVMEALMVYVYSEKVELDTRDVEQLRTLANHYGNPALVKMTEKELHSIKYYFKSIKKDVAPRRFVLYPHSFPEEASLEHSLRMLWERSLQLQTCMMSSLSALPMRNDYADAVLEVEGCLLRVHLCILCSRSDFFHRMVFSSEYGFDALPSMQCPLFRQSLRVLHIADAHREAMHHILEYIYTDSVTSLSEGDLMNVRLLSELFELADRFLIFAAKRAIGEQIKTMPNSFHQTCQLLMIADFYDVPNLRIHCLEVIASRLNEILDTTQPSNLRPDFEAFVAELADDITDAEALFDSTATKGDFHGILDGNSVSGIGHNTILEDLREKYLEICGWEGSERDIHAQTFDRQFLKLARHAVHAQHP